MGSLPFDFSADIPAALRAFSGTVNGDGDCFAAAGAVSRPNWLEFSIDLAGGGAGARETIKLVVAKSVNTEPLDGQILTLPYSTLV